MSRMELAIAAVEQAISAATHESRVLANRHDPLPVELIDRLIAAVAPRYVPNDFIDLLRLGGATPFEWVCDDAESWVDEMSRNVQQGPVDWVVPSPQLRVGNVQRDSYVIGTVASHNVACPVAVFSSNALFTVPVAPSLPALFFGFAECVRLWDRSSLADDEDGAVSVEGWWEALWTLGSPDDAIPGAAEALLRVYRAETPEWPDELPTWEGLDGPEGWWADAFSIYRPA